MRIERLDVGMHHQWGFELRIVPKQDSGVVHEKAIGLVLGPRLACHHVRVEPMLLRWSCLIIGGEANCVNWIKECEDQSQWRFVDGGDIEGGWSMVLLV
jgi:hypothetical protein